jgi:hypothetical protein
LVRITRFEGMIDDSEKNKTLPWNHPLGEFIQLKIQHATMNFFISYRVFW